jgi:hypothetical protein
MNLPARLTVDGPGPLALIAASIVILLAWIWHLLRRRRKTAAEIEREWRLALNSIGRMTNGTLLEIVDTEDSQNGALLLLYRYSVSGVDYSAAQDISGLRHVARPQSYWPGMAVTVKYDSRRPSSSIVLCEQWTGLHSSEAIRPKLPALAFPGTELES